MKKKMRKKNIHNEKENYLYSIWKEKKMRKKRHKYETRKRHENGGMLYVMICNIYLKEKRRKKQKYMTKKGK